ncbi:MAG: chemotaxis protein CheW [bacterium]
MAQPEQTDSKERQSLFIFSLNTEWFGLPAGIVEEVVDDRMPHSLPHRRDTIVKGIVNIRGQLVVCVSLSEMLGSAAAARVMPDAGISASRLLVIRREHFRVAFAVTVAHGVEPYDTASLLAVPSTLAAASRKFTRGMLDWNGHAVGCLNEDLLFHALERGLS